MPFPFRKRKEQTNHIFVRDMVVDAPVGIFPEDKGRKQRLSIYVNAEICVRPKDIHDSIDDTVSYDVIVQHILRNIEGKHINLLETLTEKIAQDCLAEKRVKKVTVRAEKLDIYPFAIPGVEIIRVKA